MQPCNAIATIDIAIIIVCNVAIQGCVCCCRSFADRCFCTTLLLMLFMLLLLILLLPLYCYASFTTLNMSACLLLQLLAAFASATNAAPRGRYSSFLAYF